MHPSSSDPNFVGYDVSNGQAELAWSELEELGEFEETEGPGRSKSWALMDDTVLVEAALGAGPWLSA